MKALNLLKIIISIMIFALFIIYGYLFFSKLNFVKNVDGNERNKMIKINESYYYNDLDSSIWLLENKLGTYKRITSGGVDSLNWDNKIVIGHFKLSYFKILLKSKEIDYFENKRKLLKDKYNIPKNKLKTLPSLILEPSTPLN